MTAARFQKAIGKARICIRGARAVYIGPGLDLAPHRNAAATVAIALERPFSLRILDADPAADTDWRQLSVALVPPGTPADDDPTTYSLPALLVANKGDDEAADIRLELAKESLGGRFPLFVVSAEQGTGLEELRKAVYDLLPHLLATNGWITDKVEGVAITPTGRTFVSTDNDGLDDWSGETWFFDVGRYWNLFD